MTIASPAAPASPHVAAAFGRMACMASHGSPAPGQLPRAVLFDALGTLVELEDPSTALGA